MCFSSGDFHLASQQGMAMGDVRHAADMKTELPDLKGQGILSKQTGIHLGLVSNPLTADLMLSTMPW